MNRARKIVAVALAAAAGVVALQVTGALLPVPAGRAEAEKGGVVATKDFTLVAPRSDVVTLRVDLRSRGRPGTRKATRWDGSLEVRGARLAGLRLWQPDPRDRIEGSGWKITTRHTIPWNSRQRKRGHEAMPLRDSALVVELEGASADSELRFTTEPGDFRLRLSEVPPGTRRTFLRGLAQVSLTATTTRIVSSAAEDDFPAAALAPGGTLHVAWVAFTHGEGFERRPPVREAPRDFSDLARPTGGDRVLLASLSGGKWSAPEAVTPAGRDVHRPALAVDGRGGVIVFWSESRDGNWDLFARRRSGGKWSAEERLSRAPGPDAFPAAATGRDGRVWVSWQSWREGGFDILARRQGEGGGFEEPQVISDAPGNQWTPSVAASRDGRIAFAWDSYQKGDYDVLCRELVEGKLAEPVAVAATLRAEQRPSIAYDPAGRLWIAYEDSPEKWGKDQGALEKEGVGLYRGRTVSVRVLERGELRQPAEAPELGFRPWLRGASARRARRGGGEKLALPRLAVDAAGRVWLAVRSPRLGTRVGVGTAWFTHLVAYSGKQWSSDVVCPGTDHLLDERPALVAPPGGGLLVVTASDGRFASAGRLPWWLVRELRKRGEKVANPPPAGRWADPVNSEIVACELAPAPSSPGAAAPELTAVADERRGGLERGSQEARREAEDVRRARAARVEIAGKTLRLWRGEFHRHTEISSDGGGDGTLMDMWRYAIDAASMDWIGNGDHDNGGGREYSWWTIQKTTDLFRVAGRFTPVFSYERSCSYPDGHRNVVFARRGIRTLPRLQGGRGKSLDDQGPDVPRPHTPDTQMLYRYLEQFDGVCASHTSGTDMGTDWRDGNRKVEPIVEIYQGCRQSYEMPGAPRSNTAERSLGGWRPFGFVSLALKKGYRLGFQASSDHGSTHISYCNAWVEEPSRAGVLAALKARHVYGSTDNIVAEVRSGDHFMGDEFSTKERPSLRIRLSGTRPFARVHVIKDGRYAHTFEPHQREVDLQWSDFDVAAGQSAYYYVRAEQEDGELVWVSPLWITYAP